MIWMESLIPAKHVFPPFGRALLKTVVQSNTGALDEILKWILTLFPSMKDDSTGLYKMINNRDVHF